MLVLGRPVNWKTSFIYAELLLLKSLKVVAQMHCSKRCSKCFCADALFETVIDVKAVVFSDFV